MANESGNYPTEGYATASSIPRALAGAVSWIDSGGNFWLFGGGGVDLANNAGVFNDLWEFNLTTKEWTWVSGSNAVYAVGIYGTQGVAAVGNTPGGRKNAVSWIDGGGNLWLFGGYGLAGYAGYLNDLWEFNPAAKTWTWVSGSNAVPFAGGSQSAVYGTLGMPAVGNTPGGRSNAVSWIDSSGNLWLFGGLVGNAGVLNDLWEFNPISKEWSWMSGSNIVNESGNYGTQGIASASNVPGAREGSVGGIDSSGNLWLFGGLIGNGGYLNDLWKFNPTSKQWTWMSGGSTENTNGSYGTQGIASASNVPGGRIAAAGWIDSSGNYRLFGGYGYDAFGYLNLLNDLWEFNPISKEWSWVSGNNMVNESGDYGTQGVAAASNVAGARNASASCADGSGNLWLFGGMGYDSTGTVGNLNDLWRYQP
ncbi:MAG: Kelch repeat-containing protein [Acidobacteriaceae bacterium]